jgi:hypothetical protein
VFSALPIALKQSKIKGLRDAEEVGISIASSDPRLKFHPGFKKTKNQRFTKRKHLVVLLGENL